MKRWQFDFICTCLACVLANVAESKWASVLFAVSGILFAVALIIDGIFSLNGEDE